MRHIPTASPSFSLGDPHPLLPGAPSSHESTFWLLCLGQRLPPGLCFRGVPPRHCLCCSGILGAHDGGRACPTPCPCPPPSSSAAVRCWRRVFYLSWGSLFFHCSPELRQGLSCALSQTFSGVGAGLSASQASENPAGTNPLLTC